ncbi:MAG: hypothetical protein ACM3QU_00455 [Verrucomicrobiota bacterium]
MTAKHDDLLEQGPHEAPAPETAEERSSRVGWGAAGGGIVGGGAVLAKVGVLGKVFAWLFAWHFAINGWRAGGWIGLAVVVAAIAAFALVRSRRHA